MTLPAGAIVYADDWRRADPPRTGCRLSTTAQAFPSGNQTDVTWSTELEDTDGFIAVPSTTITIPTGLGGLYVVTLSIRRNASTNLGGTRMFAALAITSALVGTPTELRAVSNGTEDNAVVPWSGPLADGDTLISSWFHEHGSNYSPLCWISCYRIGV